jgi:hypothetical protein
MFKKQNKINSSIGILPSIDVMTLDSLTYNTYSFYQDNIPLFILYFHPDCEFCSSEIEELLKYKNEFEHINMFFITFAPILEIEAFMQRYPLNEFEHAVIATDYMGDFASTFYIESSPMIYVYDRTKKLKKKFKGLVSYKQIRNLI